MESWRTLETFLTSYVKRIDKSGRQHQRLNMQLVNGDVAFFWLESEKQIAIVPRSSVQTINCEDTAKDGQFVVKKLACSQPIKFEVLSMEINASGKLIALFGRNGVAVLELPDHLCNKASFSDEKLITICRTVLLGDRLFSQKVNLEILCLQWFPGSPSESHIVLLTNDNCLRWFDVGSSKNALSTIDLYGSQQSSTSSSSMNFALAYGEVAVSFSIGPPICREDQVMMYPIFALRENGDVLIIWTWLAKQRICWLQKGPLRIIPEAVDNYGGKFCSILCLQTSPTVVVLATSDGVNHHCIILDSEKEELESEFTDACVTKPSTSIVLYVYDSIKMERTSNDEDVMNITSLVEDISDASCYYSINSSGVHMINLQWIWSLEDMDFAPSSDVSFLICTQPLGKSQSTEIIGFSVVKDKIYGTVVVCLLDNGEVVTRITNNKSYDVDDSLCLGETQSQDLSTVYSSPLKRLPYAASFDGFLRNRSGKSSIIKSDGIHDELTQKEFYQVLASATNNMRENYIERQTKAMIEMTKRCEILKKHKIQQMKALNALIEDKKFFGFAELVADKLLTVSTNFLSITERLDHVMQFLQSTSPVMSHAEQKWKAEVDGMQTKLMHFKRNMEMLKQKAEDLTFCKFGTRKCKADESKLNSVQLLKVKANLKEQNNKIADLMEKVKTIHTKI